MPRILVTGGAGYIGSHTAHLLRRRGYDTTIVDDLSRGHAHNVEGFPFHHFSLRDTDALTTILREGAFDAVIHFAAFIAVGESAQTPELYFLNNTGGSFSLLKAMATAGIKRLVFSSTAAVYGTPESTPIPEDARIAPVSPYGESKVMVERALEWMDRYRGLRSVVLRYFNACGADPESPLGEEHDPETHLIPLLLRAVLTGEPITIFGDDYPTPDGTCIRDYIHVRDLAEAHILAVDHLLLGGASKTYNAGVGQGHSVKEVIRAVERVTGRSVPFRVGARREGDPAALVASSARLQAELGWKPEYTSLEAIVETAWRFASRQAK
jgi:UDP-glucose 4-epimerase